MSRSLAHTVQQHAFQLPVCPGPQLAAGVSCQSSPVNCQKRTSPLVHTRLDVDFA